MSTRTLFLFLCYTVREDACSHYVKIDPDYRLVLEYIESMRGIYGDDSKFICGYEAGCLGYTLYHQMNDHGVECIILAPSTMAKSPVQKKKKTDRRDSEVIARLPRSSFVSQGTCPYLRRGTDQGVHPHEGRSQTGA